MTLLGTGLTAAARHEDALSVGEAGLAMKRRLGASEEEILGAQTNLATTYDALGRHEEALRLRRDVYSGHLKLLGEEHSQTILNGNNYVLSLLNLQRFEEVKALLRKTLPVTRRVLGENHESTLKARWVYAGVLYKDPGASLDDLREAVTTLEETAPIARRVLSGAHPDTRWIEKSLRDARAALDARETPSPSRCSVS